MTLNHDSRSQAVEECDAYLFTRLHAGPARVTFTGG